MNIPSETIIIYGTSWCGDCRRAKAFFDKNQIAYQWIDIDRDPAARQLVEKINHGNRSVPTIVFPDGAILVEPRESQLVAHFGIQAATS